MEEANKGAKEADCNEFIIIDKLLAFIFLFGRKLFFIKYAQGFIVMSISLGTIDEFLEEITLIQKKKELIV